MPDSREPAWPSEEEWGPWNLINFKDTFETRKHETLMLWERRCRHCKKMLTDIPPEPCDQEACQAANLLASYEPTSLREIRQGRMSP